MLKAPGLITGFYGKNAAGNALEWGIQAINAVELGDSAANDMFSDSSGLPMGATEMIGGIIRPIYTDTVLMRSLPPSTVQGNVRGASEYTQQRLIDSGRMQFGDDFTNDNTTGLSMNPVTNSVRKARDRFIVKNSDAERLAQALAQNRLPQAISLLIELRRISGNVWAHTVEEVLARGMPSVNLLGMANHPDAQEIIITDSFPDTTDPSGMLRLMFLMSNLITHANNGATQGTTLYMAPTDRELVCQTPLPEIDSNATVKQFYMTGRDIVMFDDGQRQAELVACPIFENLFGKGNHMMAAIERRQRSICLPPDLRLQYHPPVQMNYGDYSVSYDSYIGSINIKHSAALTYARYSN